MNNPKWPEYSALYLMNRFSGTGNKHWQENIKNWLNQIEDRDKVFDILKCFPGFVENKTLIYEVFQLIKLLNIDDCCTATDPRAIR